MSRGSYGAPRVHAELRLGQTASSESGRTDVVRTQLMLGYAQDVPMESTRRRGEVTLARRLPSTTTWCAGASWPTRRTGSG